jgi:ribosome maturation factor RimP
MADGRGSPIGVDQLAEINTSISTILDVEDPIAENYTLEISSPGIDRPLTRKKDFDSYQGFEAKLETTELIDGRRRFRGVLAGIDDDEVLINLEEGTVGLKFGWLSEARLVLSDDLIKKMLQKNTKIPVLNEENFDEIDTQIEHNEE